MCQMCISFNGDSIFCIRFSFGHVCAELRSNNRPQMVAPDGAFHRIIPAAAAHADDDGNGGGFDDEAAQLRRRRERGSELEQTYGAKGASSKAPAPSKQQQQQSRDDQSAEAPPTEDKAFGEPRRKRYNMISGMFM
jgi:hypothetical protein